jgi:hypothetical protein
MATFIHDIKNRYVSNGKIIVHEEYVVDGSKGLLVKYYHKENDKITKVIIAGKGDEFVMKVTEDGKTEETKISKAELAKEITKNKDLKFAVEYVKSRKELSRSSSRKSSKKASKKTSKKGSKKSSKKRSKKLSRKASKKRSKKGSKKH